MLNIHKFEKDLKIKFKNKSLLIEALTHKSANQIINNEKLEFLGDRVLGLILSKKLFDLYPKLTEGILDKKFASLVNKKRLERNRIRVQTNDLENEFEKQKAEIQRIPVRFGPRTFGESHWNTGIVSRIGFIRRTLRYSWKLRKEINQSSKRRKGIE